MAFKSKEEIEEGEARRRENARKMVDTSEAETLIRDTLLSGQSVFVTGGAGVGKTTLVNSLLKKKNNRVQGEDGHFTIDWEALAYDSAQSLTAIRLATTAIAGSHINGMTAHRFFKFGLSNSLEELKRWDARQAEEFGARIGVTPAKAHDLLMGTITKNLAMANVIILEEVSMASSHIIDMIHYRLHKCLGCFMPILYSGDFFQIRPVTKEGEPRYAFLSKFWNVKVFELTKVRRTDNLDFAEVLNKIRVGIKDSSVITFFRGIGMNSYDPNSLHLFSTNSEIDTYNIDRISQLPGKGLKAKFKYNNVAYVESEVLRFIESELSINPIFYFKYGTRVIFTTNQYNHFGDLIWFNGESGILESFAENYFTVLKDDGERVQVGRTTYVKEDMKNGKPRVIMECQHFPIRIGYAISIHKSQGMSLTEGHVDCTKFFLPEQFYVATSRFRDPNKLSISNFSPDLIQRNEIVHAYYEDADITTLS